MSAAEGQNPAARKKKMRRRGRILPQREKAPAAEKRAGSRIWYRPQERKGDGQNERRSEVN